jgi:hypothetical protein
MKPTKSPSTETLPPPFILFHGNSFGDIFVEVKFARIIESGGSLIKWMINSTF